MATLLADFLLLLHLAFVLFMVFGLVAVPLGGLFGWAWVREPRWRWAHLAGMAVVALQALLRVPCFLTVWERDLRRATGTAVDQRSFVVRLANDLLFVDVDQVRLWIAYVLLFVGLVAALWWVPPRPHPWWVRRRRAGRGGDDS